MKLNVPMPIKLLLLVVGTTAFYTYLGQIVPQEEAHPPPPVLIDVEMTTDDLVRVGAELASNKGQCLTCHAIGGSGPSRFPDLGGMGSRAASRREGMSDVEYLAQSLYEPSAYVVPGYTDGMQAIDEPPIGLSGDEIIAVIAWLQSLGGTPTVTLDTDLGY